MTGIGGTQVSPVPSPENFGMQSVCDQIELN